jgi:hypothetical protein
MLRLVLDSDGDTDPDTDAWGKGSRPGSMSCLTVSPRHFADGVLLGIGIDSEEGPSACPPPIPEGFQRIARGREAHPGFTWETETTPEGLKPPKP